MKPRAVEPVLIACWIALAFLLWLFYAMTGWIAAGSIAAIDEKILLAFRLPGNNATPIGPAWLPETVRDISALGSVSVLWLAVFFSTVLLFLSGHRKKSVYVFLTAVAATALSNILKFIYTRPRPDIVPPAAETFTTSFPSAHAMMSAAVYLTIGLVFSRLHQAKAVKTFIMLFAAGLTLMIGLTRVYMGVHWPSDVIAGWLCGGIFLLSCHLLLNKSP